MRPWPCAPVSMANLYGPLPPIVTSTSGIAPGRSGTEAQVPLTLRPAMSCAAAGPAIADTSSSVASANLCILAFLPQRQRGVSPPLNFRLIVIFRARRALIAAGCDSASSGYSPAMQILDKMLAPLLKRGELTIISPDGASHRYGSPDPELKPVTVRVTDNRVALQVVRDPALGTVEAWMDDRLQLVEGEVIDLLLLIRRNMRWEERQSRSRFKKHTGRLKHFFNTYNRKADSKKNVAHHYDVGNDLYRTFLDPDLQYSCGYFTDPANTIEQAQLDKKA